MSLKHAQHMQICSKTALLCSQISTYFPSSLMFLERVYFHYRHQVPWLHAIIILLWNIKPKHCHASRCKHDRSVIIQLQTDNKSCVVLVLLWFWRIKWLAKGSQRNWGRQVCSWIPVYNTVENHYNHSDIILSPPEARNGNFCFLLGEVTN